MGVHLGSLGSLWGSLENLHENRLRFGSSNGGKIELSSTRELDFQELKEVDFDPLLQPRADLFQLETGPISAALSMLQHPFSLQCIRNDPRGLRLTPGHRRRTLKGPPRAPRETPRAPQDPQDLPKSPPDCPRSRSNAPKQLLLHLKKPEGVLKEPKTHRAVTEKCFSRSLASGLWFGLGGTRVA